MGPSDEQFDEWFRRMLPVARRSVALLLHNDSAVDDTCAEAFARAFSHWGRLSSLEHRDAWLLRVAINVGLDQLRRNPTSPRHEAASDETGLVPERIDIGRTLHALPRRQRQVVSLRFLADLPEREVALTLGMSVNTVKRHTSRALASLRGDLRSMWEEVTDAD